MNKYVATLRLGWLEAVEYRTEFFINIFGWGIRLFLSIFLWLAVTKSQGGQIGEYTFPRMMQYFFIVQIISGLAFSRVGFDIARDIYRGDFANFLLRPLNYLGFRLVQEMSKNVFRTGMNLLFFGIILVLFFGGIPFALWKIPLLVAALAGAYLINFCLLSIIALSAFWIINATRLTFIYFGILTIFSGMIIPLDLFPPKIFHIIQYTPLPYIFFFPARIIQTTHFDPHFMTMLGIQAGYVAGLVLLLTIIFRIGVRRFESVGH